MVFRIERRDGKLRLVYAAFGVRHHRVARPLPPSTRSPTTGFRPSASLGGSSERQC
jgi:hypothetical protein